MAHESRAYLEVVKLAALATFSQSVCAGSATYMERMRLQVLGHTSAFMTSRVAFRRAMWRSERLIESLVAVARSLFLTIVNESRAYFGVWKSAFVAMLAQSGVLVFETSK
jgi:hypothetical protein